MQYRGKKRSSLREVNHFEGGSGEDHSIFCFENDPEWDGGSAKKKQADKSSEEKEDDPEEIKVEGRKKKLFQENVDKVKCLTDKWPK